MRNYWPTHYMLYPSQRHLRMNRHKIWYIILRQVHRNIFNAGSYSGLLIKLGATTCNSRRCMFWGYGKESFKTLKYNAVFTYAIHTHRRATRCCQAPTYPNEELKSPLSCIYVCTNNVDCNQVNQHPVSLVCWQCLWGTPLISIHRRQLNTKETIRPTSCCTIETQWSILCQLGQSPRQSRYEYLAYKLIDKQTTQRH